MATFILVAGTAVVVGCLLLLTTIVTLKWTRMSRERARERRLAPLRPLVLRIAAGEDSEDDEAQQALAEVRGPARRDVDDLVVTMLGKVRGEPAERLVEVLRAHGLLDQAGRRAASRLASRRVRALHLIGQGRDWQWTDVAIAALEDRSARVRSQAVRTVGRVGDPRAARPLLHALRREGVHVGDAAEALAGMGFGTSDALLWALEEGHPRAQTVAAHLCGAGGVRAAAPLLVTLVESHPDPTVAATAATALGRVGRPQDVGALAAASLHYFPAQVRQAAIEALGELGMEQAVPVLVRHLADPHSQVAEAAARALIAVGPGGRQVAVEHEHLPSAGSALAMARLQGVRV